MTSSSWSTNLSVGRRAGKSNLKRIHLSVVIFRETTFPLRCQALFAVVFPGYIVEGLSKMSLVNLTVGMIASAPYCEIDPSTAPKRLLLLDINFTLQHSQQVHMRRGNTHTHTQTHTHIYTNTHRQTDTHTPTPSWTRLFIITRSLFPWSLRLPSWNEDVNLSLYLYDNYRLCVCAIGRASCRERV